MLLAALAEMQKPDAYDLYKRPYRSTLRAHKDMASSSCYLQIMQADRVDQPKHQK